jgi:ribose/xylose/arabinose/galactoside ABC-type transport system permease subunit
MRSTSQKAVGQVRNMPAAIGRELTVVYAVVMLLVLAGILFGPSFTSSENLISLFGTGAPLALVALGEAAVVIGGGIDLSVGSTMSLVTVIGAKMMNGHSDLLVPALAVCVGTGAGIGLLNGLLVTIGQVQPIVATLATLSVVGGTALGLAPQPTGQAPQTLVNITYNHVGPLPAALLIVIGGIVVAYIGMRWTRFGLRVYAVGGNRAAAVRSGIHVNRTTVLAYIWSGVFAACAGIVLLSRLGIGDPNSGTPFLLTAVGAVAIGGVDLFGGRGSVFGVLGGALALSLVTDILNLRGVGSYQIQLALGIGIVVVVAMYSFRRKVRRERRARSPVAFAAGLRPRFRARA